MYNVDRYARYLISMTSLLLTRATTYFLSAKLLHSLPSLSSFRLLLVKEPTHILQLRIPAEGIIFHSAVLN